MNVKDIILEPIHNFIGNASAADNARKVRELLDIVNLPEGSGDRKPHEFSGGQRQRIGIARALSVDPEIIVCDEAVSALDVSVQAQILNLIMRLQTEKNISILFISHDLTVVERISDRIAVMYLGKIVEIGNKSQVFSKPNHPYTNALLSAVPQPDPHTKAARIILKGDVPSAVNPPSGCRFRTRCRHAMPVCAIEEPKLVQVGADHFSACHLNDGSGGGDRVPERGMQHAS